MRKTSHYLWWISCCLSLFLAGCASFIKNKTPGPICALHGVPLEVGVAPIRYGLPAIDAGYEARKEKEFPNANSYVLGGCCPGWKQVEVVAYCPKCKEADPVAQVRVSGDGALADARSFGAIEIEMLVVQYPVGVLDEPLRQGKPDTGDLLRLMRQGKGTILCAPKVITPSGEEGSVKSITEVRFPVAFEHQGESSTNSAASGGTALTPTKFQARDVGVQMSVLPEWMDDGQCLQVAATFEYVLPPDLRTNEITVSAGAETKMKVVYSEPQFHSVSIPITSVRLPIGQTVLLAGGLPAKEPGNVIYLFLSAKKATIPEKMEAPSNKAPEATR